MRNFVMGNDDEIALLRRQLEATQVALRKSETRNRLFLEGLAQAVWETDAAGAVTTDSPSWRAYTGQTEEEMLGYGWLNAVHPDDRAYAERQWREAVAEERSASAEFRVSAPGGGWRWTNDRAVPLRDEGGKIAGWIGVNLDIDARKRVEEALRKSEERFRTMADNAPVLIWETDQKGATSVNRHYTDFFGVNADEIVRMGWTNFVHPDDAQGYLDAYSEAYRQRTAYVHECRCLRADGQWRWLRSSGGPIAEDRFVGCSLDVTDLLNAQRTLRENEERQAFLLQLSDAVRPLADPGDVQGEATRRLRSELSAGWCYYVNWEFHRRIGLVLRDSAREGLPSLSGTHDVSDAPEFLQLLAEGDVLNVPDYASYEKLPQRIRRNFEASGFRSMMVAPLVKNGRLIASLIVGDTDVRSWSDNETSLLIDVAERTWAAIERARAEAEQRVLSERQLVLVAELQHRTRNILAVVRSLADRTVRASAGLDDFRDRFRDRLNALVRVQGLLSRLHEHDRVTFDELIETELDALACGDGRVRLNGPKGVRLRSSMVQTLAMALHELATNAIKYGALAQAGGQLDVIWHVSREDSVDKARLHIDWRESGVQMPPNGSQPSGGGQGRELIEKALPYQLRAQTTYQIGTRGVHCTITIPVSTMPERGADNA